MSLAASTCSAATSCVAVQLLQVSGALCKCRQVTLSEGTSASYVVHEPVMLGNVKSKLGTSSMIVSTSERVSATQREAKQTVGDAKTALQGNPRFHCYVSSQSTSGWTLV